MIFRKATDKDTDACLEIYASARAFMRANGNPTQWSGEYPGRADIEKDLALGHAFVVEDCGEVVAVCHFHIGNDPTYEYIEDGEWLNADEYGVIHRIAVKEHLRGVARFIYDECFLRIPNIKIDTHEDNLPMKRSLERAGFTYCGIIYIHDHEPRVAYQKSK
jgi:RimJ/RimL family protein N-acetyltransferase